MRRSSYKILSATFLATALGCGATTASHSPVVPAPVAAETVGLTVAEPDRSPVAAPAGLVAAGRVRAPARFVDTVLQWAELPLDWRRLLASEGAGFAEVVNLDEPIEFAATLGPDDPQGEPNLLAVVSAGLVSLDGAVEALRAAGVEVAEQKPGVFRVSTSGGASCAVAVAVGSSPARVVCGNEQALDELLPYATRGLPSEAISDSDLSLRIFAGPSRERFAPELGRMRQAVVPWLLREYSLDSPRFDRALVEALRAVANELLSAMDHAETLTFEGRLDHARQVLTLEAALALRSSDSVVSQTLTELASRGAAPPAAFWELPGDIDSVGWSGLSDIRAMSAVRDGASALVQGYLEHQGVESKAVQGVPLAIELAVGPRPPILAVEGRAPSPPSVSQAPPRWFAYALPRSLKDVERGFDAAVAIGSSPALRRTHEAWTFAARKQHRSISGVRGDAVEYRLGLPSVLAGHVPSSARSEGPAGSASNWVVIVHQRGELTWVVAAEERVVAEGGLRHLQEGSRGALGGESGLEVLRASRGFCAGALTLHSLLDSLAEGGVLSEAPKADSRDEHVWLPYTCAATRAENQLQLEIEVHLQRAFFSAATRAATNSLGRLFGR